MDRPTRMEGDTHTGRKRQAGGWGEGGKRHSKKTVAKTLIFTEPLLCARPMIKVNLTINPLSDSKTFGTLYC